MSVEKRCTTANNENQMLDSIRSQMLVYKEHGLQPKFVVMNVSDYEKLVEGAEQMHDTLLNSDSDTVNGLDIVICEHQRNPRVTTTPAELAKQGLL